MRMSVDFDSSTTDIGVNTPALIVRDGRRAGEVIVIGKQLMMGRGVDCDLTFNDPRISRSHAVVTRESSGIYIRDFPSQNGTWVNGIRLNRGRLHHRDIVRIGSVSLRVHIPDDPTTPGAETPVAVPERFAKPVEESIYLRLGKLSADAFLTAYGFESTTDDGMGDPRELRRRALHLVVLFEVSRTLQQAWRAGAVLDQVSDILLRHLTCHQLVIARCRRNPTGQHEFETIHSRDHKGNSNDPEVSLTSTTFARAAVAREAGLITNDPRSDNRLDNADSVIFTSARALMCVPMVVEDDVIGVVEVSSINPAHSFAELDLDLITVAATLIGAALQNQWMVAQREQFIAELENARTQLLAAQREREELQEELIQQEQLATLRVFARTMVHELRNTLGPVQAVGILQEKYPEDADVSGVVDDVMEAGNTALDLADNLYAYATSGEPASHVLQPVDVASVVRSVCRYSRWDPSVVHQRVQLQVRVEAEPTVIAHRRRLRQVLINLVRNAAQSIRHAKGRVRVTLREVDGHAEVCVADNGSGIGIDTAHKVFQHEFTTKRTNEGMGIGLSISKTIIDGFAGSIEFGSWPGHGTSFRVRIPLALPEG